MAAGLPNEKVTRFPYGVGQYLFHGTGAAAGNVVVTGVIKARDTLVQVLAYTLSGVLLKDSNDYTGEFTISADNQLNNTGGTSSAGKILDVIVARKDLLG
jgi:hypothetical protein